MKFTPFSDNIIFFDTEFSSLDPYKGELLSVGMVDLQGREFYIELDYSGEMSEWVQKNLIHTLTAKKHTRQEAMQKMRTFIGDAAPYMVAYVDAFDAVYTYKLFGTESQPFHWIPIDFASILFALNISPEELVNNRVAFCKQLGIDVNNYRHHHALDDAKLLRDIYLALIKTA